MNRRQFIKGLVAGAVTLAIPMEIVTELLPASKGNIWIHPDELAAEALRYYEEAYQNSIMQAAQKLADSVDEMIIEKILGEHNEIA